MSATELVKDIVAEGKPLQTTTVDQIGTAAKRLEDIAQEMSKAKAEDTERYNQLREEQKAQAQTLETLKQKHDAEVRESEVKAAIEMAAEAKAALANIRQPSMAQRIGSGPSNVSTPQRGDFLKALMDSRDYGNPENIQAAKAWLREHASYSEADPAKATLGSTAATGGWVIPNDPVDDLMKPGRHTSPILQLATVVRGLNVAGVDMPWRGTSPDRATVIAWGDQKTNKNMVYNGYTATMYTLAQIYDISTQFARKSQGAAEQDVMQELNDGLARGISYYIFQGSGSSQPYGLNAALVTAPPFTPVTTSSHTASATTNAGSIAAAIATAAGALESRNRRAEAALLSSTAFWTTVTYGANEAGFLVSPAIGAAGTNAAGGMISVWGIPIYREPEYLAGSDDLIVGEFSALKVYFGDGPRYDSSDMAGTRWDYNLIGFRGEMEMGFDARPAVYSGAFQKIADITP